MSEKYYHEETGEELVKVGDYYISKSQYDRTETLIYNFDAGSTGSVDENILNNIESYGVVSEYFVKSR